MPYMQSIHIYPVHMFILHISHTVYNLCTGSMMYVQSRNECCRSRRMWSWNNQVSRNNQKNECRSTSNLKTLESKRVLIVVLLDLQSFQWRTEAGAAYSSDPRHKFFCARCTAGFLAQVEPIKRNSAATARRNGIVGTECKYPYRKN